MIQETVLPRLKVLQVLYTSPRNPSAPDKCAYELSRSMAKLGVEVHCLYPESNDKATYTDHVHFLPLSFPSELPPFARGLVFNLILLEFLNKKGKRYNIIHIHGGFGVVLALTVAKTLKTIKAPVVMHIHGPHIANFVSRKSKLSIIKSLNDLITSFFDFWGCHIADAVAAVSYSALRKTREYYFVSPSKMHVVHNGIDLEQHKPRSSIRSETMCLFVGGDILRKGLDDLICAFKIVIKKVPKAELFIVGGKDHEMEKLAEKLKLRASNTFFLGSVSDKKLDELYDLCRVFVLPSYYEAFGLVLLEAMAHGKPIVSTRTSAIPEIVVDGETGLLVEPGNTKQLADAILELLTAGSLYQEMSKNALERVRMFTWEKSAEKLATLYKLLLRRAGRM